MSDRTPEDFLNLANQEEAKSKASLKVFFGMSPGVGKTYSMLNEAHRLLKDGFDVQIGVIETHGRLDTMKLAEGIPQIPLKQINYKGKTWLEMDIEEVIRRNPHTVLVDELAHTNIPGSIHSKRYLDVFMLLDAGINVLSTVNVQHLESQVDSVERILRSPVKETIPDVILERADELILIDIIPDELLQRLNEGKVYFSEKIEKAKENFFKKENLTYLRELSLNYTARYVEHRMPHGKERVLVAISASPHSKNILRYAKKLSLERNSELFAMFSENTDTHHSAEMNDLIRAHLRLAKELGAEVIHSYHADPVLGILSIVKEKRIQRLVIGGSGKKNIYSFWKRSIPERIVALAEGVEVTILPTPLENVHSQTLRDGLAKLIPSSNLRTYVQTFLATSLVTVFNLFLEPFTGYWTVSIIYLFYVAFLGAFVSRGPVLFAASLSAIFWNFLFIPPVYTFLIERLEDALMFVIFFLIALINGSMTAKLRKNETILKTREERLSLLYELTRELSQTSKSERILPIGRRFFARAFPFPVRLHLYQNHSFYPDIEDSKELAVATLAFQNKKPAGKFTDTLSLSSFTFYPLLSPGGTAGVIQIESNKEPTLEQEVLMNTIANQIALALERDILSEEAKKNFLIQESERMYNLLFSSLSHELKTPLTSIRGSVSALLDPEIDKIPSAKKALLEEIQESALVLNLLLGNLLDISRIESGHLKLKKDLVHPKEIVQDAISYLGRSKDEHPIQILMEEALPTISVDRVLFAHALFNLLYNACLYTKKGTEIRIILQKKLNQLFLIVEDDGEGLPETPSLVFQKFFRGNATGKIGTGLGLAITKSIVELHGGLVKAENSEIKGARFTIEIPILS
ncbi:putative histidine kinase KdpD [Leptospira ryugenii]|uniref:histidine kinase n=1 Tax=Leptospira ryugenii TaxID=1917863 RepID=A0A2P2DZN4_9LEPT|nr:ATP-binding protein [Leptospira ryugenii]GBF50087.1 putative histidine kinase KdpD [Leptospira ryugenii]